MIVMGLPQRSQSTAGLGWSRLIGPRLDDMSFMLPAMTRRAFSDLDPEDQELLWFHQLEYMSDSADFSQLPSATLANIRIALLDVGGISARHLLRSQERLRLADRETTREFGDKFSVVCLVRLISAWSNDVQLGLLEAINAYVSVCEDVFNHDMPSGLVVRDFSGERSVIGTPSKGELRIALSRSSACGLYQLLPGYKEEGARTTRFLYSVDHEEALDSLINSLESEALGMATKLIAEAWEVQRSSWAVHETVKGFLQQRNEAVTSSLRSIYPGSIDF